MDIEEILAGASRAETTVPIITDGRLYGATMDEWRRLEGELLTAQTQPPSLGEVSPAKRIAERMEQLRETLRSAEVPFRLRAMRPRVWSDLSLAQPSMRERRDGESDADYDIARGEHLDRWYMWVTTVISRSVVDPEVSVEQAGRLVDALADEQVDDLIRAAVQLNRGAKSVPFSRTASDLIHNSGPR